MIDLEKHNRRMMEEYEDRFRIASKGINSFLFVVLCAAALSFVLPDQYKWYAVGLTWFALGAQLICLFIMMRASSNWNRWAEFELARLDALQHKHFAETEELLNGEDAKS